jgi:hypothetical protein
MMYHIPYYYISNSEEEKYRNNLALETWLLEYKKGLIPKYSFINQYSVTSKDIGDERILPYVNDIIENGVKYLNDDDVVIFTNLDICFKENFLKEIEACMKLYDCGYAPRIEAPNIVNINENILFSCPDAKYGSDVFFFKVRWWNKMKSVYPKYFIGCSSWDMILIAFINICGGRALYKINYHRNHKSQWKDENVANEFNKKNYYDLAMSLFDFFNDDGNPKVHRIGWIKKQADKYYKIDEEFNKNVNIKKEQIVKILRGQ